MISLKTPLRALAERFPALRLQMRKVLYARRSRRYRANGKGCRPEENCVIFNSFNGKNFADTPKAVYEKMLADDRFSSFHFIWIFRRPEQYRDIVEEPRTSVVRYDTPECDRALHLAKYWIFNCRALDGWTPSEEQVYVQCWHGTPLKRLGFDIEAAGNAMNSLAEIREKYATDAERFRYLLSPCAFATKVFRSAWNLAAYGKEDAILETGYPRNDALASCSTETRERCRAALGFADDKRKLILYAPTWRDNQFRAGVGYTYSNEADFRYLREKLGADYVILFRAHYLVANTFDFSAYSGFVRDVSNVDDINELYLAADILLTDYSSSFFDFAVLGRPIVFYMYDLAAYRSGIRGLYLDPAELPGPVEENIEGAAERILEIGDSFSPDEKYRAFNRTFNSLHDGHAAERFVDAVFRSANT